MPKNKMKGDDFKTGLPITGYTPTCMDITTATYPSGSKRFARQELPPQSMEKDSPGIILLGIKVSMLNILTGNWYAAEAGNEPWESIDKQDPLFEMIYRPISKLVKNARVQMDTNGRNT